MQKLYTLVGLIAMVVLPIMFAENLHRDLQHPELWDADPLRDPRLYCSFAAVVVGIPAVFSSASCCAGGGR